ncbi:Uncharacterized protein TCM_029000 [Theobroma cacao]|uniref:Uncharacterized protein n=1 Tax=Theobroma cacao TaxID=3641 RepID=A0A061GAY7_THECC|nr:Uncharacterized protein TCM_029000 [Theobroma cacao]
MLIKVEIESDYVILCRFYEKEWNGECVARWPRRVFVLLFGHPRPKVRDMTLLPSPQLMQSASWKTKWGAVIHHSGSSPHCTATLPLKQNCRFKIEVKELPAPGPGRHVTSN